MEVVKFNHTIADLQAMVVETKAIQTVNLADEKELESFKEKQKRYQKARTSIEKQGLDFREEAKLFAKNVIKVENELKEIFVPEEDRLKEILQAAEHAQLVEVRKGMTPFRIKTMKERGLSEAQFPANIEELDANEFEAYVALKVTENNEAELAKLREEKEKRDKEDAQKQREQDIKEAEERARLAEVARQEKAKADEELTKKAEAEKLNKEKAYLEWRAEQGWTVATREDYKQETVGNQVFLWKRIGTYNIK